MNLGKHTMENEFKNESFQPEQIGTNEPRGPQFDDSGADASLYEKIAAAKNNGWGASVTSFARDNRAVLLPFAALVAALALGLGAIAIFNDEQAPIQLTDIPAVEEHIQERDGGNGEQISEPEESVIITTSTSATVTAEAGDGITHLARRVIAQELASSGMVLNDEQLVYAEDYLQNRTGDYGLEIGQEVSFDAADISNAIAGAQNLSDWQLENLQQYTA